MFLKKQACGIQKHPEVLIQRCFMFSKKIFYSSVSLSSFLLRLIYINHIANANKIATIKTSISLIALPCAVTLLFLLLNVSLIFQPLLVSSNFEESLSPLPPISLYSCEELCPLLDVFLSEELEA